MTVYCMRMFQIGHAMTAALLHQPFIFGVTGSVASVIIHCSIPAGYK